MIPIRTWERCPLCEKFRNPRNNEHSQTGRRDCQPKDPQAPEGAKENADVPKHPVPKPT